MARPASAINAEFDSRILRVSSGFGGMTRPQLTPNGQLAKVSCLHCGKDGGAVSSHIPPSLRGDPGVIYVCMDCTNRLGALPNAGTLPATAISFARRAQ